LFRIASRYCFGAVRAMGALFMRVCRTQISRHEVAMEVAVSSVSQRETVV